MRSLRFSIVKQVTEQHIRIINLAYRSPPNFQKAWTGEGHLIEGPRHTVASLAKELSDPGCLLVECHDKDDFLVGSFQLKREADDETACSLGLINVDPSRQGEGIGRAMIEHASVVALEAFPSVTSLVMWVLERRFELISWYEKLGFEKSDEPRVPFPTGQGFGQPRPEALQEYGGELRFLILRKPLRRTALVSGHKWDPENYDWQQDDRGVAFAPSADRNKEEICGIFSSHFAAGATVLEVGSGTGQHLEQFALHAPNCNFLPSEISAKGRDAIRTRCAALSNVKPPLALDLRKPEEAMKEVEGAQVNVVCAINVFHVAAKEIIAPFAALAKASGAKAVLIYGAFNRHGSFTTESNQRFDATLREANPAFGLRDVESEMQPAMLECGFALKRVHDCKSNNFVLEFESEK